MSAGSLLKGLIRCVYIYIHMVIKGCEAMAGGVAL